MELETKKIGISQEKNKSNLQITLDDDFNVPDAKPDIDKVVKEQGTVIIQEINPMNERFILKGVLEFSILYGSQESSRPVHNMSGEIPFEESVNMEGITSDEVIMAKWEMEDMSISLINSRKVNVKAIISFDFTAENGGEESVVTGVEEDGAVQSIKESFDITQAAISKKDTIRMKDEITLPMGKDNVLELLYTDLQLSEIETKVLEDKISVKGLLKIFILYMGENENRGIEYYEAELPINQMIECGGCRDDMVSDITVFPVSRDIQIKPDEDGEERILDLEAVLNLDIRIYEEEKLEVLKDIYSTKDLLNITRKEAEYKNLLMKNSSKLRVVDTLRLEDGKAPVLQICEGSGTVKIDDKRPVENGIEVDGVVSVQILYITEADDKPIGAVKGDIPFSQIIEIKDMKEDAVYDVKSSLDQLGMILINGMEIEVKATIALEAIVFEKIRREMILGVEEAGSLNEVKQKLPSIVGYIVKEGDTLWKIAKDFYTTVDEIKKLNELESDDIIAGQKLIICK